MCRNVEPLSDLVEQSYDPHIILHAVGRRVDADHRVADAEQEPIDQAGDNSAGIVGRMVRLQARGEPSGKPDGVPECCRDAAFGGDDDEVLRAHDLGHGSGHLRCQAGRHCGQAGGRRPRIEQPFPEFADRQMRYRREGGEIVAVEDQARDLVFVIRNKLVVQEGFERKIGQRDLGGDALDRALCRDAGQRIAGARRRGFGEERLEIGKAPAYTADRRVIRHAATPLAISETPLFGAKGKQIAGRATRTRRWRSAASDARERSRRSATGSTGPSSMWRRPLSPGSVAREAR